jgi:hypothetical protein
VRGLRVHITGSAASGCDETLLSDAHDFVRSFVELTIARGGGLVLGAGDDPLAASGASCVFDWTALERVAAAPDPGPEWPKLRPERFVAVASQRALDKVPEQRAEVWRECRARSDFDLDVAQAGWRMAGIIRERQVLRGDILLVLGGGAGAEHLAELYRDEGKPVVPLYAELGSLNNDGSGGSRLLFGKALPDPSAFFRLRDGTGSASSRLSSLRLLAGGDAVSLAERTAALLTDLRPRPAFYARLLDPSHADYTAVESFFREVVDPVVVESGFTPHEIGRGRPESAFMNLEIFRAIHRAGLVVVDLSGVRPNCTMELGYALARRRRVVLCAMSGTDLPFDSDKLPTYMWRASDSRDEQVREYREWLDRYSEMPPIVE